MAEEAIANFRKLFMISLVCCSLVKHWLSFGFVVWLRGSLGKRRRGHHLQRVALKHFGFGERDAIHLFRTLLLCRSLVGFGDYCTLLLLLYPCLVSLVSHH